MRRTEYRWAVEALCFVAMLGGSSSCSEQEEAVAPLLSDQEISFCLSEWKPVKHLRTTLFEKGDDLRDVAKGGGNFTLYAHVAGTNHTYINKARVWFHKDPQVLRWIFLDGGGEPITYYWPNSGALNFFAYMPDSRYDGKDGYQSKPTYVGIGPYTEENGQTFSCTLPETVGYDTEIQEFIYAYEKERTKTNEPVPLQFKHPFALINFKVAAGSYRMTIDRIVFRNIHLNGTFSTANEQWTSNETREYTAEIGKRIPNDVNYNTLLGDPFIVMPQSLKNVQLVLYASRTSEDGSSDNKEIVETFTLGETDEWMPGNKYTYTIKYGDNNEEIYFSVAVEPWTVENWIEESENNIEVE